MTKLNSFRDTKPRMMSCGCCIGTNRHGLERREGLLDETRGVRYPKRGKKGKTKRIKGCMGKGLKHQYEYITGIKDLDTGWPRLAPDGTAKPITTKRGWSYAARKCKVCGKEVDKKHIRYIVESI